MDNNPNNAENEIFFNGKVNHLNSPVFSGIKYKTESRDPQANSNYRPSREKIKHLVMTKVSRVAIDCKGNFEFYVCS